MKKGDFDFWGNWFGTLLVMVIAQMGIALLVGMLGRGGVFAVGLLGLGVAAALVVFCRVTWDRLKSIEEKLDRLLENQEKHDHNL